MTDTEHKTSSSNEEGFWSHSTRGIESRSFDYEVDALTTSPGTRHNV